MWLSSPVGLEWVGAAGGRRGAQQVPPRSTYANSLLHRSVATGCNRCAHKGAALYTQSPHSKAARTTNLKKSGDDVLKHLAAQTQ